MLFSCNYNIIYRFFVSTLNKKVRWQFPLFQKARLGMGHNTTQIVACPCAVLVLGLEYFNMKRRKSTNKLVGLGGTRQPIRNL